MMNLRVKDICKAKSVSVTELAAKMNIAQESLSRAINGNPTLSTLEKIADALGVEVVELFAPSNSDFTALIDHAGILYRFDDINSLKQFIERIMDK